MKSDCGLGAPHPKQSFSCNGCFWKLTLVSSLQLSTWSLEVNYPGSIWDLEDFNEEQGM